MLIKYRDDRYSMGHMPLFLFPKAGFGISYNVSRVCEVRKGLGERERATYPPVVRVR